MRYDPPSTAIPAVDRGSERRFEAAVLARHRPLPEDHVFVDWIAGAVGVVGIVATGLTARGGRKHAERLAQEGRSQARLAEAYVELLGIVNRSSHWAQEVRPLYDTNPPRDLPPLPPVEEQLRAETLIMAYGSTEVRRLFEQWRQSVWAIIRADHEIGFAQEMGRQGAPPAVDVAAVWKRLNNELRPAQLAHRDELARTIAAELRARDAERGPRRAWWRLPRQ